LAGIYFCVWQTFTSGFGMMKILSAFTLKYHDKIK